MISRFFYRRFFPAVFLLGTVFAAGADPRWYRSNAAGMALEPVYSRLAVRGEYALMVDTAAFEKLPEFLRPYYRPEYRIELRALYKDGAESRRQWVFRDEVGRTRLVSVFNAEVPPPQPAGEEGGAGDDERDAGGAEDGEDDAAEDEGGDAETAEGGENDAETAEEEGPDRSGFIEMYDENGLLSEEHRIDMEGVDRISVYIYNKQFLIRAETRIKTPPSEEAEETVEDYCTDYYRYSRSYSLRSVERVFHQTQGESAEPVRLSFPHMILGNAKNFDFVRPGSAYGSDFFEDILTDSASRILYATDERGRILTETRRDEEGTVIGELRNTWSGDRLASVLWVSGEDERLTEYEYNSDGDRVLERNFNKGVLERTIRQEGEQEIEELYMDGRVILRAIWENGRKVSETRVSGGEP